MKEVVAADDVADDIADDVPSNGVISGVSGDIGQWKTVADFFYLPPPLTWRSVGGRLLKQATPLAASSLLFFSTQAVTLMYVGNRLGDEGQAGYAIGLSLFNVTGMSICIGFMSGIETLCSQSFGRDPSGRELAVILLRGFVLSYALCIPIIILFYVAIAPLMIELYGPTIGGAAAAYLKATPFYMLLNTAGFALQRAFQSQQAAHLGLIPYVISGGSAPFIAHWLIHDSVETAPLTTALVAAIALTGLLLLAAFHPDSKLNRLPEDFNFRRDVLGLTVLKEFSSVGLPALAACCAEWWAFELLLLAAARNGALVTDAFTVSFNVMTILYSFPNGCAVSSCVAIGNHLGANEPSQAEAWTRIGIMCQSAIGAVDTVLLLVFGNAFFGLYNKDPALLALLNKALLAVILFHVCDMLQTGMQATFRGVGKQEEAAKYSLATIWLVGLPCGIILSFWWPFVGPLVGFSFGIICLVGLMGFKMRAWRWQELAAAASQQQENDDDPIGETHTETDDGVVEGESLGLV